LPTRLALLLFAALLALAAAPALANPGPGSGHQVSGGSGHKGSDDNHGPDDRPACAAQVLALLTEARCPLPEWLRAERLRSLRERTRSSPRGGQGGPRAGASTHPAPGSHGGAEPPGAEATADPFALGW
jgi:hypothetical protein